MAAAYGGLDSRSPAMSLRRFKVLLDGLPPVGRLGGEEWSTESYLLALLVDAVHELTWVTLSANSKTRPRRPQPLPRPKQREPVSAGAERSERQPQAADGQGHGKWAEELMAIQGVRVRRSAV